MFSRHGRVFKLLIWLNVNDVKMWLFSCCVVENDVYLQMILSRRVVESPVVMDLAVVICHVKDTGRPQIEDNKKHRKERKLIRITTTNINYSERYNPEDLKRQQVFRKEGCAERLLARYTPWRVCHYSWPLRLWQDNTPAHDSRIRASYLRTYPP